ncbi:MAG TPA: hypothetical protein ACFE0H_14215 [Elainellaceae cyanobacterium]
MSNQNPSSDNFCLRMAGWLVKGIYLGSLSFIVLHLVLLLCGVKLPAEAFMTFLGRTIVATFALFFVGACWSALFGK